MNKSHNAHDDIWSNIWKLLGVSSENHPHGSSTTQVHSPHLEPQPARSHTSPKSLISGPKSLPNIPNIPTPSNHSQHQILQKPQENNAHDTSHCEKTIKDLKEYKKNYAEIILNQEQIRAKLEPLFNTVHHINPRDNLLQKVEKLSQDFLNKRGLFVSSSRPLHTEPHQNQKKNIWHCVHCDKEGARFVLSCGHVYCDDCRKKLLDHNEHEIQCLECKIYTLTTNKCILKEKILQNLKTQKNI